MKKALIVIDYVNDFVAPDGALTCGRPAQDIDACIAERIDAFVRSGDLIVNACDHHEAKDTFHPEHRLFPPHCIAGTAGAALYGKVAERMEAVPPQQLLVVLKSRYSAFAGTGLDLKLRERGVTKLALVGVCSDICVLHTAVDAYNLGYAAEVHAEGTASFSEPGHAFALRHFQDVLGFKVL